jgi:hypothetical protein
MITVYFRSTIDYIIVHYWRESRRHFSLSLNFAVLSAVFCLGLGAVYAVAGGFAFGYFSASTEASDIFDRIVMTKGNAHLFDASIALGILCFGLYGSFVISTINDERLMHKTKFTFRDFRAFISAQEWNWFMFLAGMLLFTYFITFRDLSTYFYPRLEGSRGILGLTRLFGRFYDDNFLHRLLLYLDKLIALAKTCLAYFFALLFIITVYENKMDREIIRKYKDSLIAGMCSAFIVNTLGYALYAGFQEYTMNFIYVFFYNTGSRLIALAVEFGMLLSAMAFFTWPVAAAFCLPIKFQAEGESDNIPEEEKLSTEGEQDDVRTDTGPHEEHEDH